VKNACVGLTVLLCCTTAAEAQTKGRVGIGGSITFNATPDSDVGSVLTGGPLIRLNPRRGWRLAGALNWMTADLDNPAGGSDDFATLRTRPLMGGVSYTIGPDHALTSFSIVMGPSFNRARFDDEFALRTASAIDADNSFAVRPGVNLNYSVSERVGIVGFAGYLFNRPDVLYRDSTGREFTNQWKADAVVLSVGVVYGVF
jgi:outer membrane protein with beta-barrel domain